jgi:hypothetical protein
VLALLVRFGSPGAATAQPSFSCAAAHAPVEKLICSDPTLAGLDAAMAAALRANPGDRAAQRQWLAGREIACPTGVENTLPEGGARDAVVACLGRLYEQRIATLDYARNRAAWPKLPVRPSVVEGKGRPLCEAVGRDIEASLLGPSLLLNPLGEREIEEMRRLVDVEDPRRGRAAAQSRYAGRVYLLAPLAPATTGGADVGVYELAGPTQIMRRCLFVGHVPMAYFPYEPPDHDVMAVLGKLEAAASPLLPSGKVCDAYGDGPRSLSDHRQYRPWLLDRRLSRQK